MGLNAVRNVGSNHEAGGGDGGVRDDDFVKFCGQGVVQYPPHTGVLTAILPAGVSGRGMGGPIIFFLFSVVVVVLLLLDGLIGVGSTVYGV